MSAIDFDADYLALLQTVRDRCRWFICAQRMIGSNNNNNWPIQSDALRNNETYKTRSSKGTYFDSGEFLN